jgi:hypothetical protein
VNSVEVREVVAPHGPAPSAPLSAQTTPKPDLSWDADRLTVAPDWQSAGALSASVSNRHEFARALVEVWTVINRLSVPDVPPSDLDRFQAQPQTVIRPKYWLDRRLGESEGRTRSPRASGYCVTFGKVRVGAHPSSAHTQHDATEE